MSEITTQQSKNYVNFNKNSLIDNQLPYKNNGDPKHKLADFERLKKLYPYTDVNELPLAWSFKDKANFISLSDNNLKVNYKGIGKGHKDAASVRAEKPIPQSCLLYYFEIKIICKGRDGFMGIGLAAETVNLQRLPGWDKQSYGYHGDDGHSFSSSGTGQQYGPTFTTNDIIGCGFNLVENKCFYTKNGFTLGVAFTDLANIPLYPTVGLQTPGEEIEANFGLEPFVYDIHQEIEAARQRLSSSIINFPVKYNEWQYTLNKIIQSWLIHNGYHNTAEVFSSSSKQDFKVNVNSIKQRLQIQQYVLNGKIGEAIDLTNKYYPNVLKNDPNLLFALKCRQFVEMIKGFDSFSKSSENETVINGSNKHKTQNNNDQLSNDNDKNTRQESFNSECLTMEVDEKESIDNKDNSLSKNNNINNKLTKDKNQIKNGNCDKNLEHKKKKKKNNSSLVNNNSVNIIKKDNVSNKLPQLLEFGKELNSLSHQLSKQYGSNKKNEKMLGDAFSLIAYADPSASSIAWQLEPSEREQVCLLLNNAIIKSDGSDGCCLKPPLEAIINQTKSLLRLNNNFGAWLIDKL